MGVEIIQYLQAGDRVRITRDVEDGPIGILFLYTLS